MPSLYLSPAVASMQTDEVPQKPHKNSKVAPIRRDEQIPKIKSQYNLRYVWRLYPEKGTIKF